VYFCQHKRRGGHQNTVCTAFRTAIGTLTPQARSTEQVASPEIFAYCRKREERREEKLVWAFGSAKLGIWSTNGRCTVGHVFQG
jgi:hypothetical protein